MNLRQCSNSNSNAPLLQLVHRANDLSILKEHANTFSAYEIDVQWFRDAIYVYHDDMNQASFTELNLKNVCCLAEFIDNAPANIIINVEVKVYSDAPDINELCKHIVSICARRPDIDFIFSSFNESVYLWMRSHAPSDAMMLADTIDAYLASHCGEKPWVCVDANMLDELAIIRPSHQRTFVYNVKLPHVEAMCQKYSFVTGVIFDF